MLGHPPGTSGPRTSMNTAERNLLRAAHPTGRVRDVATPRDPTPGEPNFAGGVSGDAPVPPPVPGANAPPRKTERTSRGAPTPAGPGERSGGWGRPGGLPPRPTAPLRAGRCPAPARARTGRPPSRPATPKVVAGARQAPPSPQTSARARAPPRVPSASGPRGGAAAGTPRDSRRPRRRRPQAPGRGVPEGAGPRAARPPRRGRRACGGGGAARGAQPIQGRGSKCRHPRSFRRPAPHSRAPRAASPFRARHAAAILFTSLPLPAPPRTPHARPQGTPPLEDDVPTRWLNLPSPALCPPRRR